MIDVLKAYLQIASGVGEVTRQRALEAARQVLAASPAAAVLPVATAGVDGLTAQVTDLADDLLAAGRQNRELLRQLVRAEVETVVTRLGLGGQADLQAQLAASRARVRELERAAAQTGSGTAPSGTAPSGTTSKRATTPLAGTKKSTTKKSTSKKSTSKKSASKQRVTKQAVTKQAPAASDTKAAAPSAAKGTPTRVAEVVARLTKSSKPAKMTTLRSSIKSWFKPALDDKAVDAIVQSLQGTGKITVDGTRVAYAL